MNFFKKNFLIILIFIVFFSGAFFGNKIKNTLHAKTKTPFIELEHFAKVLEFVESNYVDDVDPVKLVQGSIDGMLKSLDPHSSYLTPEVFTKMQEETSGRFGGLGIEVIYQNKKIIIVSPIEDSPAYKAGIKPGDEVLKIDGSDVSAMTYGQSIHLMKGKPGTKIEIVIKRKDVKEDLVFNIKREIIKLNSIKYSLLNGNIGYIKITSFAQSTNNDLLKALSKIKAKSKQPLQGFILDLRGNPGGLLDQAVKVSNVFISEGPVVYSIGKDPKKKDIAFAQKGFQKIQEPLIVLVNKGSASASEIVAGALQDYQRAVIVGQRTFGKGSVQTIVPIGKTAGLKLTIARYYTPSGKSIQATGIVPDVILDDLDFGVVQENRTKSENRISEKDLKGHISNQTLVKSAVDRVNVDFASSDLLKEKIQNDYMLFQVFGLLKTLSLSQRSIKIPKFVPVFEAKNSK